MREDLQYLSPAKWRDLQLQLPSAVDPPLLRGSSQRSRDQGESCRSLTQATNFSQMCNSGEILLRPKGSVSGLLKVPVAAPCELRSYSPLVVS